MSENTNKILWISVVGIVATAVSLLLFYSVTKPTKNMYDSTNSESLCASSDRANSLICLDASNNSQLGQHIDNSSSTKTTWYAQGNLEEQDNGHATLSNFDFNDNSGWLPYALKFDGSNDIVKLNLGNANFANGMTLQLNVKPLSFNSGMTLISNGNIVVKVTNKKVVFTLKTSSGTYEVTSSKELSTDTWYLIHVTYNNDRMKIYINGELDNYKEISGTITTTATDFTVGTSAKMELSSIIVYSRDIKENGINQNVVAIYNKVYSIDMYRENFGATDSCVKWTVPITGEYQVELWGAQGGSLGSGTGGKGAYTSGNIVLTKGASYYICVGKKGTASGSIANGGNATDMRLTYSGNVNDFNSLKTRVMVAAGGGGGYNANGGAGGMLKGLSSNTAIADIINAKGATQTSGGTKATKMSTSTSSTANQYVNGVNGKFGQRSSLSTGATGGNGYYSGGSISYQGGAAGGSSYISGYTGVNSILSTSTSSTIIHSGSANHYSGTKFFSAKMINGKGNMPSSSNVDGTTYGQAGDGHARITFISLDSDYNSGGAEEITPKPGKPSLMDSVVTSSSITATYTQVENAATYVCYYGTSSSSLNNLGVVTMTLVKDRQCNISSLEQNKNYYVKMVAINGDQLTESDVSSFHTEYATPSAPQPIEISATQDTVVAIYSPSDIVESYSCKLGTSMSNLTITGTVTYDASKRVICTGTNLLQDTNYYVKLTAKNGDKTNDATVININTTYATPDKPVLVSSNSTTETITNTYSSVRYATSYRCVYGLTSGELNKEGAISTLSDGKPVCTASDLTEGTTYYFQLYAMNGNLESASDINSSTTSYREPDRPNEIRVTSTNNSITTTFEQVSTAKSYECYYGTSSNSMTTKSTVTALPSGENQCYFGGLKQNTTYYYYFVAKNGDKSATSQTYSAKTLYNNATKPTYKNSTVNSNVITSNWNVTNQDEQYICEMSINGTSVSAQATPTISGNVATCKFTDLSSDSTYYFRVQSVNGTNIAYSDWHTDSVGVVLPNISGEISGGEWSEDVTNWSYIPFDMKITLESDDQSSVLGAAYCVGTAKCTPTFEVGTETTGSEETGASTRTVVKATGTSKAVTFDNYNNATFLGKLEKDSETNYICVKGVTKTGKSTDAVCFGPYRVGKEKINTLDWLEVKNYSLTPQFQPLASNYLVVVEDDTIEIVATPTSKLATVEGTGVRNLTKWGTDVFTITVTAQNGDKKEFTIRVMNQRPTAPTIQGGSETVTAKPVTISIGTAGTAESGVDHYEYYLSDTLTTPNDSTPASGTTTTGSVTFSEDCYKFIWYRTVSTKGNTSEWSNYQVINISTKGTYKVIPNWQYTGEFYNYKTTATKIVLQNSLSPVANATESWDMSVEQNGSIMAYYVSSTKTIYIQANGKIKTNKNASLMFNGFSKVTSIQGLENLDTSETEDMTQMFSGLTSLNTLDLNSLNTSNVKILDSTFSSFRGTTLKIDKWDVSNVENMEWTFNWVDNLSYLNLNSWNTSKLQNMEGTFRGMSGTTLDVNNWDVSHVTTMQDLFWSSSIQNANISYWNLASLTNTYNMFTMAHKIIAEITIKTNVTNYADMFYLAADQSGRIVVNYASGYLGLVNNMLATTRGAGNAVLGSQR